MVAFNSWLVLEVVEQHVVVSREQSSALYLVYQVVENGMGDGISVKCRGSSTKLVQYGQRAMGCKLNDVLCLLHFDKESRLPF